VGQKDTETDAESAAELIHKRGYNPSAMASTLGSLSRDETRKFWSAWGKEWTEVECGNGEKALVLKNPTKAFEFYGKEWSAKFSGIVDVLQQAKAEVTGEASNKIEQLFKNLDYVNGALREMYYNHYLTFMATPCSEKAQSEKHWMDRMVGAATMSLVTFRMVLESTGTKDLDKLNEQLIKLTEKISDMMLKQS
jgi:hypothetical protein